MYDYDFYVSAAPADQRWGEQVVLLLAARQCRAFGAWEWQHDGLPLTEEIRRVLAPDGRVVALLSPAYFQAYQQDEVQRLWHLAGAQGSPFGRPEAWISVIVGGGLDPAVTASIPTPMIDLTQGIARGTNPQPTDPARSGLLMLGLVAAGALPSGSPVGGNAPAATVGLVSPTTTTVSATPTPSAGWVFCNGCGRRNHAGAQFCSACGAALPSLSSLPAASPAVGQTGRLAAQSHLRGGRYRIVGMVGRGGMGAVYKALDTALDDRPVAIKEMGHGGLDQHEVQEAAEAFRREASLLAHLVHPCLPRIYDHFEEGGRWYLVMDYIEGETLEQALARQPGKGLPVEEVLHIGERLCAALGYLHGRQPPVIFRDLKPANVMRSPEGDLYLIDFGIARHFKAGQARDTVAMGSPGYAAPEQYNRAQTDARADIYSLGATLNELLTGRDPSQNTPTVFHFPPLQLGRDPAALELAAQVTRMVEIEVGKRPASTGEVRAALQRIALLYALASLQGSAQAPAVQLPATTSRAAVAVPAAPVVALAPEEADAISLLCVCDQKDDALLEDFKMHLRISFRRFVPLTVQDSLAFPAGGGRKQQLEAALDAAHVVVLLASPSFLGSDECSDLADRAVARYKAGKRRLLLFPVRLRPVDTTLASFQGFGVRPYSGKAVVNSKDELFVEIMEDLRKHIFELITHGERSGAMSLYQWLACMFYKERNQWDNPNTRFDVDGMAGTSVTRDDSSFGELTFRVAGGKGKASSFTLNGLDDPEIEALARAAGSPDGRPQSVSGTVRYVSR